MAEEQKPYFNRLQEIKLGIRPKEAVKKERKAIPKKSAKKIQEEKDEKKNKTGKAATKLELDTWFAGIRDKHWKGGFCNCMECGEPIPISYSRHATAHLLPKKLFKSVAIHDLNYLILGAQCGCHYKTDRIDKFVQMKVWPEAARRIKIMIPLLPFEENQFLSNQLLIALDNTP